MISVGHCYTCKCEMWIPDALNEAAQHGKGRVAFYCAYGHSQVFSVGESELTKMRRERDRLQQQLAEKDDDLAQANSAKEHVEASLRTTKGHITRIKNRVGHGVCPCCNRTFGDLSRHMASQHPTYAEAAE